jgi:tetratricopeptide (TPR) repeat protein
MFAQALEEYLRCIDVEIATIRDNCTDQATWSDVANCRQSIGELFEIQKDFPKSLENYQDCIKIVFGPTLDDSRDDDFTLFYIIQRVLANFDLQRAMDLFQICLRLKMIIFGEKHASTAHSHFSIGLIWHGKGNFPFALKHYRIAMLIQQATIGATHACWGVTMYNIGTVLEAMGRTKEALESYTAALKIRLFAADKDSDLITANLYQSIGFLYQSQSQFPNALMQYLGAFNIRLLVLGQSNETVMRSYDFIAGAIKKIGKFPAALTAYADPQNLPMRRELIILARSLIQPDNHR